MNRPHSPGTNDVARENAHGRAADPRLREEGLNPNSFTGDELQRIRQQLRLNMSKAQRLQRESAVIKQEVHQLVHEDIRPARRRRQLASNSARPVFFFPGTEFTIEDLENANASMNPTVVRFHLASAVSQRCVEFILPERNDGWTSTKPGRYRVIAQSIRNMEVESPKSLSAKGASRADFNPPHAWR